MAVTTDTTKTAESRNPFYAIIGLNDLFIEQGKAAAERTQERFDAYRDAAIANITTIREELDKALAEGRERANELQKSWTETDSHDLQAGLQEYLNAVLRSYTSLVERGERIFEQVAKNFGESPVVKRVAEVGQSVAKQVEEATDQAEARVRGTLSIVADKVAEQTQNAAEQTEDQAIEVGIAAQQAADKVQETAEKVADAVAKPVAEQETINVDVAEETPAAEVSTAQTSDTQTPDTQTPASQTPATQTPVAKAAPRKTAARKSAPRKAAPRKTAAKTTASKTTASKTAGAKAAGTKTTGAKTTGAKTTAAKTTAATSTPADNAADSE